MTKIAFLFPGQGSQYSGMHQPFVDDDEAQHYISRCKKLIGFDYAMFCRESSASTLMHGEFAQPAIFLTSFLWFRAAISRNIIPHYVAGHSLGEFSALCCAGVLDFDTALSLVYHRGKILGKVLEQKSGLMVAIEHEDTTLVPALIKEAADGMNAFIGGRNSRRQWIVSGERSAVEQLTTRFKAAGAVVLPLKVFAAFHTPMLSDHSVDFQSHLNRIEFGSNHCTCISSVTGKVPATTQEIAANLRLQMVNPVMWYDAIQTMRKLGATFFIEAGPGQLLTSMLKREEKSLTTMPMHNDVSMSAITSTLGKNIKRIQTPITENIGTAVSIKNYHTDENLYTNHFLKPFQRLVEIQDGLEKAERLPTRDERVEARQLLKDMLEGKAVPLADREKLLLNANAYIL